MKTKLLTLALGLLTMFNAFAYNKTVDFVDMERFMGDWYVVAGRFTMFEKNMFNAVETYKWNAKEQRIDIGFTYNQGSFTGPVRSIPQKGWIHNSETNAHWKVSPFWPLRLDYLIIGLAADYEWTVIGVPNEKYVWIMSRNPQLPKETIKTIIDELDGNGYNTRRIIYVEHDTRPASGVN
jgi:apolipoprotein D and lipocalin family protein